MRDNQHSQKVHHLNILIDGEKVKYHVKKSHLRRRQLH